MQCVCVCVGGGGVRVCVKIESRMIMIKNKKYRKLLNRENLLKYDPS